MSPRPPRPKREPEPVEIDEGGVLVKHCDNIPEAERVARAFMAKKYPSLRPNEVSLPGGRVIWCRIIHCLPKSSGAYEGWSWMYQSCREPGRGIFRAVAFDCAFPHVFTERWSA